VDDEDNTILWVLLGAAVVYFLMKRGASAAPMPQLPAPRGNVTQNADGTLTINQPAVPDLTQQAEKASAPNFPASQDFVIDPIFGPGGTDFPGAT
jgi:hypothetical protein